jgi:hypothetical protein
MGRMQSVLNQKPSCRLNGSLAFLFGEGANMKNILVILIAVAFLFRMVEITIVTLINHLSIKRI